nr:hypothetical protein [Tanacetum cinerariifolium]
MYDSWASRIRLFIKGKKHGRMMLDSIDNGQLVYPTVEENGQTRPMKYSELTEAQQLQDDYDVQATNIIFTYWRFSQLINDMHTIGMTMQQVQVNTKFLNDLPSEWSKFVTDVKLAKSLYNTNYDQLYAHLSQHKRHANEVHIMRDRYLNPLTLVANSPTLYNSSQLPQPSDLNAQLQEKVFAITTLKNELRKLKGKNVVDTVVSKSNATIALGMFKLDIEPLSLRLKNNKDVHEVYIEKTIKYTDTLLGFAKCARTQNSSEPLLEYACMVTKHV